MKYCWVTDIHINFPDLKKRRAFYQTIVDAKADAAFITGDIAEAPSLQPLLLEMHKAIQVPMYFVLGNHDYYNGDVETVRNGIITFTKKHKNIRWLGNIDYTMLTKDTALLGVDGWADGRLGDYAKSEVVLNDSHYIADLAEAALVGKNELLAAMQLLADQDSQDLADKLNSAKAHSKHIIVLTHVPPFIETCRHKNKPSDKDWLPFFASQATGNALLDFANENPAIQLTVYCGHTHSSAECQITPNLLVKVGAAKYGQPAIKEVMVLDEH